MEIRTIGTGGRIKECERLLSALPNSAQYKRVLLLPIPTTRDKKYITGTEISLSEAASLADNDTLAVGYAIPDELGRLLCARGANIYDASLDEDFLIENADITANGAVGRILTGFEKDISELSVGVVGFGRIGKRMVSLLLFFGADVRVYTGREAVVMELCEAGVACELLDSLCDFSSLDLLVNTAPAKIMSEEKLFSLPASVRVMDLASGRNFPECERVLKLASVPDAMYPKTAGGIYAKYAAKKLLPEDGEVLL